MANYYDTARRWVDVVMGWTSKGYLQNPRMPIYGDRIHSYGSHFEIARPLRIKGEVTGFLFNGNTYSNMTTKHQGEVRSALQRSGLPMVTIPYAALDAARIDPDSVRPVDVSSDWWEEREEVRTEAPGRWEYEERAYDMGGWVNSRTGVFVGRTEYGQRPPEQETCERCATHPRYDSTIEDRNEAHRNYMARIRDRDVHLRVRHGVWDEVSASRRNTGRKTMRSQSYVEWELVDEPDAPLGYVFCRTIRRHRLGGSLIRAQVRYMGRAKCRRCEATGQVEPWIDSVPGGLGPLDRREDGWHHNWVYDPEWEDDGRAIRPRNVPGSRVSTTCPTCDGTRWERCMRRRWAYFLSGFDENETRPSYFFCELPAGATPTTVDEAMEALKPGAVKLAEQMGREVKRQGDIFAVPMPGITLKDLKDRGGRHITKPRLVIEGSMLKYATAPDADLRRYIQHLREHGKEVRVTWSGPRPQLLGTNHEATEIVQVGRELYARGTIRHVPDRRRPDHKMLTLGREFHLVVKNTVPVGI